MTLDPGADAILKWTLGGFWVSFLVSALLAKPILATLIRLKSRQTISQYVPDGHAVKQGTPTMGGLIILAGAIAGALAILIGAPGSFMPVLAPALVLLVGFGAIGFVDDFVVPRLMKGKRGLGWSQKLAMQLIVAAFAAIQVYGFDVFPVGLLIFSVLFYSNAYNFSDGLDGLAGSLLIGLVLGFGALLAGSPAFVVLPLLLGGVVSFLFLNAPPAKVFMGDVGSLPIGAVLGFLATVFLIPMPAYDVPAGYASWYGLVALVVVSGMMIGELVPVPLQILSVKIRKKKLFFYTPIHHGYEKRGWPETRVVWAFALSQLLMSALAATIISFGRDVPKQDGTGTGDGQRVQGLSE